MRGCMCAHSLISVDEREKVGERVVIHQPQDRTVDGDYSEKGISSPD